MIVLPVSHHHPDSESQPGQYYEKVDSDLGLDTIMGVSTL